MQITDIKPEKQKIGIYRIYLNGKYTFSIHKEVLHKLDLKKGDYIQDLSQIKDAETLKRALDYTFSLLRYSNRTEKEINERLAHRKYSSEIISIVVNKLKHLNLINDEKLAEIYTEKRLQDSKGMNLIKNELLKKGVSKDIVERVSEKYKPSEEQEIESARKLFDKKIKGCEHLLHDKIYKRVSDYLARRGFSPDVINKLFREWKKEFQDISLDSDQT